MKKRVRTSHRPPSKGKSVSRKESGYCEICGKLYPADHLSYHSVKHHHFADGRVIDIRVCTADLQKLLDGEHGHLTHIKEAPHLDPIRHIVHDQP